MIPPPHLLSPSSPLILLCAALPPSPLFHSVSYFSGIALSLHVCVRARSALLFSLLENRTKTGLPDPNNAALAPSMLAMLCCTLQPWTRPLEPSRTTPGPDIRTATYSHVHTLGGLILRAVYWAKFKTVVSKRVFKNSFCANLEHGCVLPNHKTG